MIVLLIALIYTIGFIISRVVLVKYGEEMGFGGFDEEKTYVTMDDYSSNAAAWTAYSSIWPIFWGVCLIAYIHNRMVYNTQKKIDARKTKS